jgi:selenide,water dikinase
VYRLTDDTALVQTVDFFTPIVDDPFVFGQIAAANALSDVYAMGGRPITAMNIVTFPSDTMDIAVLREILQGGLDKTKEADTPLLGGHTVKAPELKYGLSVTGIVHPDKILTNGGARLGDRLILTKALGTGIISTALKADMVSSDTADRAAKSMTTLNRMPAEIAADFEVHACTDITGFGLLGHAVEMIVGFGLGMQIEARALPVFSEVETLCGMGLLPGGLHRNRKYFTPHFKVDTGVPQYLVDVVCDPQTSGGLLFSVSEHHAHDFEKALASKGILSSCIGNVVLDKKERLLLK